MTDSRQSVSQEEAALERSSFVEGWVGRISYWIFRRRRVLLIVFVLITILLGAMASQLRVQAGFTKMIPLNHEYMKTFLEYQADFGGANRVLVAVKNRGRLAPRVYEVPNNVENWVAKLKLASMGIRIDTLTQEQQKYLSSWAHGT